MTGIAPETPDTTPGETFFDWRRINAKWLSVAAGAVVAGGIIYWFVTTQQAKKEQNADRSLLAAKQSLATNNIPLAQTDLQRITSRWGDTRSGVEAALLLAQVHYDKGEYQKGIDVLRNAEDEAGDAGVGAAVLGMIADGQAQLGKVADAAKGYERAAEAARYAGERNYNLAKAARSYGTAGDTATSRKLWERLTQDPDASEGLMAEARVRLGELTAKPASRS